MLELNGAPTQGLRGPRLAMHVHTSYQCEDMLQQLSIGSTCNRCFVNGAIVL